MRLLRLFDNEKKINKNKTQRAYSLKVISTSTFLRWSLKD